MESLRPCTDADAAPLHRLFRQAVLHGAEGCCTVPERAGWAGPPDIAAVWAQRHAETITLVAAQDGRITGDMMMHPDGCLDMAFVRADRRRTPTAALLHDAILAEAQRRALPRLTVLASRLMERFLAKCGWRPAPERAAEPGELPQNRAMLPDLVP